MKVYKSSYFNHSLGVNFLLVGHDPHRHPSAFLIVPRDVLEATVGVAQDAVDDPVVREQ